MANNEHVRIIKEGIPVWNKWRREHPDIVPNLDRANLDRASLDGANLYGASLNRANLYGASLDGANLYGASLDGANLNRASLYGANLNRANLDGANLYGANLDGANLNRANLNRANLYGANLNKTGVKEIISLLPFPIVVLDDNKVRIGCGEPKTIKTCLAYTEDTAFEKGLPRDRYPLYQSILKGLLK
jgi:uncharacterized protein YjbI with pentapeptide repeats